MTEEKKYTNKDIDDLDHEDNLDYHPNYHSIQQENSDNLEKKSKNVRVNGYVSGVVEDRNDLGTFIFTLSQGYTSIIGYFKPKREELSEVESLLRSHEIKETLVKDSISIRAAFVYLAGSYIPDECKISGEELSFPRIRKVYKAKTSNIIEPIR